MLFTYDDRVDMRILIALGSQSRPLSDAATKPKIFSACRDCWVTSWCFARAVPDFKGGKSWQRSCAINCAVAQCRLKDMCTMSKHVWHDQIITYLDIPIRVPCWSVKYTLCVSYAVRCWRVPISVFWCTSDDMFADISRRVGWQHIELRNQRSHFDGRTSQGYTSSLHNVYLIGSQAAMQEGVVKMSPCCEVPHLRVLLLWWWS